MPEDEFIRYEFDGWYYDKDLTRKVPDTIMVAEDHTFYGTYRKAGYSRKFFEAHREEITIHKAAKKAFDELGVKRIPRVKDLNAEYARLMTEKKQTFTEYRKARDDVKEYLIVRENITSLYEAERKENEADRKQQQEQER